MYRHEGQGDWPIQGFRFRRMCPRALLVPSSDDQTYGQQAEADAAIQQMNEQELDGRRVRVSLSAILVGSC